MEAGEALSSDLVHLCLRCGRHTHELVPCFDRALVRRDFPFPNRMSAESGRKPLTVVSSRQTRWSIAVRAVLTVAAGGWLLFLGWDAGICYLALLATGIGSLWFLIPPSRKARVSPGALHLEGGGAWDAEAEELDADAIAQVVSRVSQKCFEVVAMDRLGGAHLVASGLRGRRASEMLAAEVERVLRLAPFRGISPVEVLPPESEALEVAVPGRLLAIHLRATPDALEAWGIAYRRVHLDADAIGDVGVHEIVSQPFAVPRYALVVRSRRGEERRLVVTSAPLPLLRFVSSARRLWRLDASGATRATKVTTE